MRWITAALVTALMVAGCGGSSSSISSPSSQAQPSPSPQAQVPTLQHTSDAYGAIYADVSSEGEGDTACTTQQSQLAQQVQQIRANLRVGAHIAGIPSGVFIVFRYGSPAFPTEHLSALLSVMASGPPFTSVYTNMEDTGDQYDHASIVLCIVTT